MAVYAGPMFACLPNAKWRWREASHLTADTLAELHAFADRLGLLRRWFQNHRIMPHYDLSGPMRLRAVRLGAVDQTQRDELDRLRLARKKEHAHENS